MTNYSGGTIGTDPLTGGDWAASTTPAKTTYQLPSTYGITDPWGGNSQIIRQENGTVAGQTGFGGNITFLGGLGEGDEVWVRWYEYFPTTFMFANGDVNDGGSAALKWMRFQGTDVGAGGAPRLTYKPWATADCTWPCSSGLTTYTPKDISGENTGWDTRYPGRDWDFTGPPSFARGQWVATQVYLRLSKGDGTIDAGNGLLRVWVNNTLIGETQRNTLPPVGHVQEGSLLQSLWWGNYWNGGFPQFQSWYHDEVIVTTQTPNTVDSGGRPFIHPDTRVIDF